MSKIREWLRLTDGNLLTDLALWAVLLLPLVLDANLADPFDFGRFLHFMFILTAMLLGLVFVKRDAKYRRSWWRSPILYLMLGWLLVTWVSALLGVNFYRSFWGTASRATGLLFITSLFIFIVALLAVVRTSKRWLKILSVVVWMGSISALYAILSSFGIGLIYRLDTIGGRIGGLLANPIFLGNFLLLTIFLTLYFVVYSSGAKRYLYLAGLMLQLTTLVLAASRGPLLGFVVGLLLLLFGLWKLRGVVARWKFTISSWLLVLGCLAVAGVTFWWNHGFLSRLLDFGLGQFSIQSRLIAWGIGLDAIKDRLWLGYGLENIQAAFNSHYQPKLGALGLHETIFDRLHNFLLDQLAVNGVVGFVFLVLVVFFTATILAKLFEARRKVGKTKGAFLALVLSAGGVAYLVSITTLFDVVMTLIYGSILVAAIIFLTSRKCVVDAKLGLFWRIVATAFLAILLVLDLKFFAPAYASARYVALANRVIKVRNYQAAHYFYNQAQHHSSPYLYFLLDGYLNFGRLYVLDLMSQNQLAAADGVANDTLVILNRIRKLNPDNPTLMIGIPVFYVLLSETHPEPHLRYLDSARQAFAQLAEENPNREYMYLNWARVMIGVKQFDDAKAALDKAGGLSVPPRELDFWWAIWGIESKRMQPDEIIANLRAAADKQIGFIADEVGGVQLVASYLVEAKDWQTALYYQEQVVSLRPEDIDELINLATLYKELGQLDKVVEVARRVVELDPSRQESTQLFLQSIGRSL